MKRIIKLLKAIKSWYDHQSYLHIHGVREQGVTIEEAIERFDYALSDEQIAKLKNYTLSKECGKLKLEQVPDQITGVTITHPFYEEQSNYPVVMDEMLPKSESVFEAFINKRVQVIQHPCSEFDTYSFTMDNPLLKHDIHQDEQHQTN